VKRKTPQEAATSRETTERLLDTVERLFGEHGYDGVGMRLLAEAAKVNLGAATYHFGSKQALYVEALMRRLRPVNGERLRLLRVAQANARGRPLLVETIVECMVRPPYVLGLEHPGFHALLARGLFMPPPFLEAVFQGETEPINAAFVAAFRRSLGAVPVDLIHLRVTFSMGALLMFSVRMGTLRPQRHAKFDDSLLQEVIRFIAAGLQSAPAVPPQEWPPNPRPAKTHSE